MENFTFGLTMTVVGMGGTLVSLWVLTLCMNLLKKAFPHESEPGQTREGGVS